MIRYKYLKDCKPDDWVYYESGELCQVKEDVNSIDGEKYVYLTTGYINSYVSKDTKVYPITIHTKVIAETIHYYYNKMHEKNLINGSRWVNWLSDKFDEAMLLDDDAERSDYDKIWNEIEAKIKELEYHKSFL